MKLIALIIIAVAQMGYCTNRWDNTQVERQLYQAGFKIENHYDLAVLANESISNIVKLGAYKLRKKNDQYTARQIEVIWKHYDGMLIDLALGTRDIGWYEPISDGLALIYDLMEQQLGFEVCHALRLDDIKTINHGLRVAFRPCYYGYDEYFKHLAKDPKYRALLPVLSYWTVVIGCSYATYGIGYVIICSPAGYIIEKVVENRIAPKATKKLYDLACKS